MLTAKKGEEHDDEAMSAGANAYLTKPVDADELVICVSDVLQQNSFRNTQR
jgi:DNA-binding response OmpR family regulator